MLAMTNRIDLAPIAVRVRRLFPGWWDALAALLVLGFLVLLAELSLTVEQPLTVLQLRPLSLSPSLLPTYAVRTTVRMLLALVVSLLFTFTYATLAAKSRRAATLLIPLLDILQSVPILGFVSVTIVFFMSLAPGRILGAELAAIFAIFTSQAWNMAFSFYQSLRTVPADLVEAARSLRLTPWMRFWRVDVPFAMPQLVWNMMMSLSGSWFFVVASEAISVGKRTVTLPGIGSYIAFAVARRDLSAIGWAIATMLIVILVYDQILFRPLIAWAWRFRIDQEQGVEAPRSWVLTMLRRSRLIAWLARPFRAAFAWSCRAFPASRAFPQSAAFARRRLLAAAAWYGMVVLLSVLIIVRTVAFILNGIPPEEIWRVTFLGLLTMIRVLVLIAIASAIWVPTGIWLGLHPRAARIAQPVAQFLAAFPANLLFPVVVSAIVAASLNPDIWLSPLMVLGTQWYILFNVVAGADAIPGELRDIATTFGLRGWLWWRRVGLPAVFPYYVTGAVTASGGSWNASIVAETAQWGKTTIQARGIGAYIAQATAAGDFHRIVLGIAVMSAFVIAINRAIWRPLYLYAERKFRLG
jgi:NitT/TauT family transport system permease protein